MEVHPKQKSFILMSSFLEKNFSKVIFLVNRTFKSILVLVQKLLKITDEVGLIMITNSILD